MNQQVCTYEACRKLASHFSSITQLIAIYDTDDNVKRINCSMRLSVLIFLQCTRQLVSVSPYAAIIIHKQTHVYWLCNVSKFKIFFVAKLNEILFFCEDYERKSSLLEVR